MSRVATATLTLVRKVKMDARDMIEMVLRGKDPRLVIDEATKWDAVLETLKHAENDLQNERFTDPNFDFRLRLAGLRELIDAAIESESSDALKQFSDEYDEIEGATNKDELQKLVNLVNKYKHKFGG